MQPVQETNRQLYTVSCLDGFEQGGFFILVQPNETKDEIEFKQQNTLNYLWNVMVLAKRFKMRIEFVDTIFMRLVCQFGHTIRELWVSVKE